MATERERAAGLRKQALFRAVNDRIEEVNEVFGFFTERYVLLCECGRTSCMRRVEVPVAEYRRIREDERAFVVAPGHEQEALERVVRDCPSYRVVALRPEAQRLVERDAA